MQDTTINVLGTEYAIELRQLNNEDIDGFTDNTSKLIVIRSDNYNEVGNFAEL